MATSATSRAQRILTLNAGSSSLKAAVFAARGADEPLAAAQVDRIGTPNARLRTTDGSGALGNDRDLASVDHAAALQAVLDWVRQEPDLHPVHAVAHRVVHGGDYTEPQRITSDVVRELRRLVAVDPDHLPQTLLAIRTIGRSYRQVAQVACFDTAFHRTLPSVARMYPLPSRFQEAGVRRYGFHGLSCEYIVSALRAIDPHAADSRLVIAHLGNGASMTAVHRGRSVETTMGFSPAGGLMMGTRTGDLDPGVLLYALRRKRISASALNRLVNAEAGLLGVSGTTADMHDLLAHEATDPRAAAAVALFCYLAKKALGSLLVTLGGLDTLVFTGGIGEHRPVIRDRITDGLGGFGISIDASRNATHGAVISSDTSPVAVRVMQTNEDLVLARHTRRLVFSGDPGST